MAKKIVLMLGFLGMASMVRADMIGGMIPPGGGGGTPGTPVNSVQFNSAGSFTGDPNFNYSGSSLSILAPGGLGVTFGVTAGSITAGNLVSGNCVQAAAGGALTTTAGACASTAGFASLTATQTFTGGNTFQSTTTFTQNVIDIAPQGFTSTYVVSAGSVTASSATIGGQLTAGTFVGNGAAITAIAGPNITTVIPSSVLVSSVAYLSSTQTWTAGQTFTSSVTVVAGSSLTLNGLLIANGAQGTSGQVLQSNGSSVPSWTTLASASLSSTQTWSAAQTFASSAAVNGGFYSFPVTISGTQAIFSTHTVVLASAPPTGITLTLDASNAADKGQILQITKVDTTTGTVTIKANGTDLVAGSTRTLVLNAIGQTDQIIADGNGNWWPYGTGLQTTPAFITMHAGGMVGSAPISMTVSSDVVSCLVTVPVPVAVMGWSYDVLTAASAEISFAVLDLRGNVLASSNTIVMAVGRKTAMMTTPVNLPPGAYAVAYSINNVGGQVTGITLQQDKALGCARYTQSNTPGIASVVFTGADGNTAGSIIPAVNMLVSGGLQTFGP